MKALRVYPVFIIFAVIFAVGVVSNFIFEPKLTPGNNFVTSNLTTEMAECEVFEYSDNDFASSERRNCYNDKVIGHIKSDGLKSTLVGLENYMQTDQGAYLIGARCHDLGHGIGIEAVKNGYKPREILETCNTMCEGGCLNGAAHVFVITAVEKGDLDSFCDISGISKTIRDMCYHGIGHGLMEYYTLDIDKVVKNCLTIKGVSDKFQCSHAAFMETTLVGQAPFKKIPANLDQYCGKLEPALAYSCFQFGGFLTFTRDLNINEAFEFCQSAPENIQMLCFSRIGESAYLKVNGDPDETVDLCRRNDANEFRRCLKGANIFSVHSPDSAYGEKATNICLETSDQVRRGCLSDLGAMIVGIYGESRLDGFCKGLQNKNDRESCLDINETIINEQDWKSPISN